MEKGGESPGRGAILPTVLLLIEAPWLGVLLTLLRERCAGRRYYKMWQARNSHEKFTLSWKDVYKGAGSQSSERKNFLGMKRGWYNS